MPPTYWLVIRRVVCAGLNTLLWVLAMWTCANIGYRIVLAHQYHWDKYSNHVDPAFFGEMTTFYVVAVAASAAILLLGRKASLAALLPFLTQTAFFVAMLLMHHFAYLVSYEEFIRHGI